MLHPGGWGCFASVCPSLWPAASILYLKGAELSILQLNTNERLCVEFEFLSSLTNQRNQRNRVRWQLDWTVEDGCLLGAHPPLLIIVPPT